MIEVYAGPQIGAAIAAQVLKPKCNHILAFDTGVYEAWLIKLDDQWQGPGAWLRAEMPFNFCPLCGEKLEKPKA